MIEYIDDDLYSVGCSLPDLRFIAYVAAALVVVAGLVIVAINRLRPW